MSDDVGDRLTRLEAQREHDKATADRWNGEREKEIGKLDKTINDGFGSVSKDIRDIGTRLTKMEGKMGVVWAALAAVAMMVGGTIYNLVTKGGAL